MRTVVTAACTAAVLTSACVSDPVALDYSGSAVIYGRVTTTAGEPISHADIQVLVTPGTECGAAPLSATPSALTDSAGDYRERFSLLSDGPFTGCVVVEVRPAAGSGHGPHSVSGGLAFFSANMPFDSLRVDIIY